MDFTPSEIERIAEVGRTTKDWAGLSKELGRPRTTLYQKFHRMKHNAWERRIEVASQVQAIRQEDSPFSFFTHIRIETKRPIAVLMSSDWQLGSQGTDMDALTADIAEVRKRDGFYLCINGDVIHNVVRHKTVQAEVHQVMQPVEQMWCASDCLEDLIREKKLLSLTLSEEHDQRDERLVGYSTFLQLLKDKHVPIFNNRGVLVLQVGSWYYVIYFVHKSRYGSILNELHSGNREYHLSMPANVICTAHRHRAAWGKYPWYPELAQYLTFMSQFDPVHFKLGEEVYLIQTGTYETDSEFGTRFFGQLPRPKPILLVLRPDRFHVEVVEDFDSAAHLIDFTR